MKNLYKIVLMTAMVLFLSSCASTKAPTFGDKVKEEAAEIEQIGSQWAKGENLLQEGQQLLALGRQEMIDGDSKIKKGESLIKRGTRMKQEAEEAYQFKKKNADNKKT